jgi:hypothetical protein
MTQFILLFFFYDPNNSSSEDQYLSIADFSPVFEVFMGIGFAFFVLTKVDDFLYSMLGVEARTDEAIMATIDSNIELAEELITESRAKSEQDLALDLSEFENALVNLKLKIAEERFRVIHNARFYFLLLGFHALTMLIFCGLEDYCLKAFSTQYKACFYSALLFANIFFISANILLVYYIFQQKKDEPILWKSLLLLALLIIMIGIGVLFKLDFLPTEMLIFISVISVGLPFILLLNRHARFKSNMRRHDFENKVEEIRTRIGRTKIRLNNIPFP